MLMVFIIICSQSKIADILSKDSPGDEILHELGILNRTLNDILDYLFRIEFWPGLQIFGTPCMFDLVFIMLKKTLKYENRCIESNIIVKPRET